MRKLTLSILILMFVLFANTAMCSPFLVCDSQSGISYYKLTGWSVTQVVAQTDGSLKMDVSTATPGVTSLTVSACINDAFGEVCSDTVPFSFTRGIKPLPVRGLKLVQ
jgi:hypothetical protein